MANSGEDPSGTERIPSTDEREERKPESQGGEEVSYDDWPVSTSSDHIQYVGLYGGQDGSPVFYDPEKDAVYEGELDRESERIVAGDEPDDDFDPGETIGEYVHRVGDGIGWESLSEFGEELMGGGELTGEDARVDDRNGGRTGFEPEFGTFTQANVAPDDDHQLEFSGSYTYQDETDRAYIVERSFEVYTEPGYRRDGRPVAAVFEHHLRGDDAERGGDAEPIDRRERELVLDVDSALEGRAEEAAIENYLEEWHREHGDPWDAGAEPGASDGRPGT